MDDWPLLYVVLVFLAAAAAIFWSGTRLAGICDRLADRTGMGEALMGALFLGASTSLPGITTSVTAAADGHPQLAISNAIGGIAAQTVFLAVADFFYRRANLEHAAASVPNLISGTVLIALVAGVLLAGDSPDVAVFGVHPATFLLVAMYLFGLKLIKDSSQDPQWNPEMTAQTELDEPDEEEAHREPLRTMWIKFLLFAVATGACGYLVAHSGVALSLKTGMSESFVGAVFTAISTSTPELVTAVAAVRRGALTLAVGDIIGGNAFDVMFATAADVAYREGSIYHAISPMERYLMSLTIAMVAILVLGLLHRQRRGLANVGFESMSILALYLGGIGVLWWMSR